MKAIACNFIFIFFMLAHCAAQTPLPQNVKRIEVKRLNDSYIDAYIYKTDSTPKLPLLIFCQGTGYTSNTKELLGLASRFSGKAAGLVIEKQGVKYGDKGDSLSSVYKENNTIYNRIYDYLRVLQYLRKKADWWNGDIYLIGDTEGGLVAGMLASFYPSAKGLALLSYGGGLKFKDAWPISAGLQKKETGADATEVFKATQLAVDSIKMARQDASYNKSYNGADNTFAWWASVADIRLSAALLDLDIPIFIGHGSDDLMAPIISAKKLEQEFAVEKKSNLLLKVYKGYNHRFMDAEKKSHFWEVASEAITWILEKK